MTNPTTAMTLRLPTDLYERLRTRAFEERTSMTALIVQAVQTQEADRG